MLYFHILDFFLSKANILDTQMHTYVEYEMNVKTVYLHVNKNDLFLLHKYSKCNLAQTEHSRLWQ